MNTYKKTIIKALSGKGPESMCSQWKEWIYERHPELRAEEFKAGDWVIYERLRFKYPVRIVKTHYPIVTVGLAYAVDLEFHEGGKTYTKSEFGTGAGIRKATPEEIKAHLIEEAKRRGYDKHDFESISTKARDVVYDIGEWSYLSEYDSLFSAPEASGGKLAYKKGKWAKLVPEIPKVLQKAIDELGEDKIKELLK